MTLAANRAWYLFDYPAYLAHLGFNNSTIAVMVDAAVNERLVKRG